MTNSKRHTVRWPSSITRTFIRVIRKRKQSSKNVTKRMPFCPMRKREGTMTSSVMPVSMDRDSPDSRVRQSISEISSDRSSAVLLAAAEEETTVRSEVPTSSTICRWTSWKRHLVWIRPSRSIRKTPALYVRVPVPHPVPSRKHVLPVKVADVSSSRHRHSLV